MPRPFQDIVADLVAASEEVGYSVYQVTESVVPQDLAELWQKEVLVELDAYFNSQSLLFTEVFDSKGWVQQVPYAIDRVGMGRTTLSDLELLDWLKCRLQWALTASASRG
jgi:hypothetical protein